MLSVPFLRALCVEFRKAQRKCALPANSGTTEHAQLDALTPGRTISKYLNDLSLRFGQRVALSREPHVEGREYEDAHHQINDQASNDNDREGPL